MANTNTTNQRRALEALRAELLEATYRAGYGRESSDITPAHDGDGLTVSVRHFGDWQNPIDAEDEEDYDWQVPTENTCRRLTEMMSAYSRDYGVRMSWHNEGEKNWLRFVAK